MNLSIDIFVWFHGSKRLILINISFNAKICKNTFSLVFASVNFIIRLTLTTSLVEQLCNLTANTPTESAFLSRGRISFCLNHVALSCLFFEVFCFLIILNLCESHLLQWFVHCETEVWLAPPKFS